VGSLLGPVRGSWTTLRPFLRLVRVFSLLPVLIQVNEVSERVVAAQLGETAVAATEFANFVVDTCVTLLAVPVGLAALAAVGREEASEASARARAATVVPLAIGVGVPLSVLFLAKAEPLAATLYQRGAFTAESSSVTAVILQGFAAGLWCQILAYILAKLQSGAMQPRAVVRAAGAGVAAGLGVLLLALPTGSALFIGLAGSAYGLVSALVSARLLGVLRQLATAFACALPGAGLAYVAVGAVGSASAPLDVAVGAVVCCAVWLAYCLAVPCFRGPLTTLVRRR
jgi:putative peptidoglycan lipid II flippase